jgi:hypothetical protein
VCLRLISQLLLPFADNASAVRPGEAGQAPLGTSNLASRQSGQPTATLPIRLPRNRPRSAAAKQRSAEFHLLQLPVYFIADSDDYDHKNARHIINFRSINLWQHAI